MHAILTQPRNKTLPTAKSKLPNLLPSLMTYNDKYLFLILLLWTIIYVDHYHDHSQNNYNNP